MKANESSTMAEPEKSPEPVASPGQDKSTLRKDEANMKADLSQTVAAQAEEGPLQEDGNQKKKSGRDEKIDPMDPFMAMTRAGAETFPSPGAYATPGPAPLLGSRRATQPRAHSAQNDTPSGEQDPQENIIPTVPQEPQDIEMGQPAGASELAVANPVENDIPQAEEWPEQTPTSDELQSTREKKIVGKNFCLVVGLAIVFVLLIVSSTAIFATLGGTTGGNEGSKQQKNTEQVGLNQYDSPREYLYALLPNYTIEELKDSTSPQSRALEWILDDQGLNDYPSWRILQRFALATIFYSTGGTSQYGSGWFQSDYWLSYYLHECDWYQPNPLDLAGIDKAEFEKKMSQWDTGNYACTPSGEYQSLHLFSNGLEGSIPPELSLLSELKGIALNSNQLTGSLPSQLGNLSQLTFFDVMSNSVTSSIPTQLGNLKHLEGFYAMNNELSGPIPSQIGSISSMIQVFLVSNRLTGQLPSELGELSHLTKALLETNRLSGPLPSELGQLEILELALHDNAFTGTIPTQYGNLANATLFSLGDNEGIIGTVPTQLGNMRNMANLGIWNTNVNGSIPSQLGKLTKLEGIMFPNNQLSGPIPSQLGLLSNMWALSLFNNRLSGPVPPQIGNLKSLMVLQLNDNDISGGIPSQVGQLKKVEFLDLSHNQLSGTIPPSMGTAKQIQELRLNHNQLTGEIPNTLGLLFNGSFSWVATLIPSLILPRVAQTAIPTRSVLLGNNRLTGALPSELGSMQKVLHLSLQKNYFTGNIPTELGLIDGMEELFLNSNGLVGSIPSELGLVTSLHTMNLAKNAFTGTVPEELSSWSATAQLVDISDNQITGTLPAEFCTERLNVSFFDCSPTLCGCDCPC